MKFARIWREIIAFTLCFSWILLVGAVQANTAESLCEPAHTKQGFLSIRVALLTRRAAASVRSMVFLVYFAHGVPPDRWFSSSILVPKRTLSVGGIFLVGVTGVTRNNDFWHFSLKT